MKSKEFTFEEIEAHVAKANLDQYKVSTTDLTSDPGAILKKICKAYKGVRPIIAVVTKIPLIPASIRNAIQKFMEIMDSICTE